MLKRNGAKSNSLQRLRKAGPARLQVILSFSFNGKQRRINTRFGRCPAGLLDGVGFSPICVGFSPIRVGFSLVRVLELAPFVLDLALSVLDLAPFP